MAKNLVIVESPTKAKTIEKYLGPDYKVLASIGHVRDLPRSDFAIDTDGSVALRYEVPTSSTKVVSQIRKAAKEADNVFLATDLDREGEAIAWHVAEVAQIDTGRDNRVVFTEITRDAILRAFEEPRRIDGALGDAQQARRAVDRIVGYRLSPTLWRNVSSGISAGRVALGLPAGHVGDAPARYRAGALAQGLRCGLVAENEVALLVALGGVLGEALGLDHASRVHGVQVRLEGRGVPGEAAVQRPVLLGHEAADLVLAVDDDPQRHRLHPAGRDAAGHVAPQGR